MRCEAFLAFVKTTLGDAVAEVRASDRLTDSAVCLVAPELGPDRQLEKLLAGAGRLASSAKPILEINPRHNSSSRWPSSATATAPSRRMRRICCSTRRACSTASGLRTRGSFPIVSGRVLGRGLR